MYYVVVGILLTYAVFNILRLFGVFEKSSGTAGLKANATQDKKKQRKRKFEIAKLRFYTSLTDLVQSIAMTEDGYVELKFLIDRLEIRSSVLDRLLTPAELRGRQLVFFLISLICVPLIVFSKLFLVIGCATAIVGCIYITVLREKVSKEDDIINLHFIDLYLLMYSKLRQGSKARLQKVVESYIETLRVSSNVEVQATMMKFAKFFVSNLSMYEDHVAVPMLRERYKSAVIVNFCNIATQALQGIDNADSLLTLKQELMRRKSSKMRENAERLRQKGEKAIYMIYVVLFILILVSWYSKMPADMFDTIHSMLGS